MPNNGHQSPQWKVPEKVRKEIDKLSLSDHERAYLRTLMGRRADGENLLGSDKHLRDGVRELRLKVDRRNFRLYYCVRDGGLLLLALHFQNKKKNRDHKAVQLAVDRSRKWDIEQ